MNSVLTHKTDNVNVYKNNSHDVYLAVFSVVERSSVGFVETRDESKKAIYYPQRNLKSI